MSHDSIVAAIKRRLQSHFGIGHATVEVETGSCADTVLAARG